MINFYMHHIYQTPGFILSSNPFGEANQSFRILTRDLGFIKVSAQGVRLLKSKLRYAIQDFSYCDLFIVRGREKWRVVGVSRRMNLYEEFRGNFETFQIFARVFSLLERLLYGEEKNEELFRYVEEAVLFAVAKKPSSRLMRNFEYILVLRVLSSLGYLGSSPDTAIFVESPFWSDDLLVRMNSLTPRILGEINRSLKESQL
ncbi:MAG: repair protein RecO protein [Candidatus Magasanikbacteria bacterium GW2011_GWA2_46_17]|uniref:Repair protein RecO protein n=1 Tax=Candidatus Magasanikbacteria bacterium GW2011_GWA2_46_17 TaxID=1619042 RepID=A0A0G1NYI7_9BACT|nr:MAG: repair protein RecO protein [Candidatus Magasanikbacteria bacterium GW2011_GWA2_46_17]